MIETGTTKKGALDILVVDDCSDDRALYKHLLATSALGRLRVREASTGEAALRICRERAPDCVLLDYRLPDLDGLEFLRAFRDELGDPLAPVVMLSGEGSEEVAARAIRLGAQDYMVKSALGAQALNWAIVGARARFELGRRSRRRHEELRHFAHSAAHDLKAPLRKVESLAKILVSELPEEVVKATEFSREGIRRALDQMRGLISGLLTFARAGAEANAEVEVDLNAVVRDALDNLDAAGEVSRACIDIGELPSVRGEPNALVQVFQNLLGNALKFSRKPCPGIDVRAIVEGDLVTISVADDGIGIDSEHVESVFEPFRRLNGRSEFEGSGLGLATCRRIVEHLGGAIRCESELGVGSVFIVTLHAANDVGRPVRSDGPAVGAGARDG